MRILLAIAFLFLSCFYGVVLFAQSHSASIKGIVFTADNKPAAAVSVVIKEAHKASVTGDDGSFIFNNIAPREHTLQISLLGYETTVYQVTVAPGKTSEVSITLKLSQQQLQDVVVYTNTKKLTQGSSDYVAKMPLKNIENAQVYTTITKELLREQLVFSADDAMKNAPGIQKMWEASGRSGDGGAYYNARGFILQSQLRNGVAGNVSGSIDAANLESIEVIKGPSATLFGSTLTSYGGLINRVTKKPYASFGGEINYASGSYGYNRIAADINTPLDSAKNVLLRVNTAYRYEGSFQDNGFDRGLVIAPSLSYKVNDKLSFLFDGEFFSGANSSKPIIFFYYPVAQLGASRADQLGIDYKRAYSANDIFQVSRNNNLFGQMNYKISPKWLSQTNFSTTNSFSDGPYAYFYLVPNSVVKNDPAATGSDYLQRADQSTANSSINVLEVQQNFIGEFNIGRIRNRFVGGLDVFSQNSKQLFYGADFDIIPKNGVIANYANFNRDKLDSVLINGTTWKYPYTYKTNTYSAYASDVINITNRLIVMAAVRVDNFDNKGSFNQQSGLYTGGYNQTAVSPKFGLVFQPVIDKLSLFVNYQNGFTNVTGADSTGKTFKPEQAWQLEAGVKLNAFNGKLNATLSYYDIKVQDMVRPSANPTFSVQDGTQVSKGFEAEVIANPLQGLNVVAGFAYNDSKMEKSSADVEGRRPATAMSPTSANLWISYRMVRGTLKGLGIGFGGNYASDNKIVNSVYYGEFILPAYTVLNASVFYDNPKFRAGIKMDNLTNKEYWIGYTTMNPQKLRSVTASIAFKF